MIAAAIGQEMGGGGAEPRRARGKGQAEAVGGVSRGVMLSRRLQPRGAFSCRNDEAGPALTEVSEGAYSPAWRPQNFVTDLMQIPTAGRSPKNVPVGRTSLFGIMPRRARLWST